MGVWGVRESGDGVKNEAVRPKRVWIVTKPPNLTENALPRGEKKILNPKPLNLSLKPKP